MIQHDKFEKLQKNFYSYKMHRPQSSLSIKQGEKIEEA